MTPPQLLTLWNALIIPIAFLYLNGKLNRIIQQGERMEDALTVLEDSIDAKLTTLSDTLNKAVADLKAAIAEGEDGEDLTPHVARLQAIADKLDSITATAAADDPAGNNANPAA